MKYIKIALFVLVLGVAGFSAHGLASAASQLQTCNGGTLVPAGTPCPAPGNTGATTDTTDNSTLKNDACNGLDQLDSSQSCDSNGSGITTAVQVAVNILSIVVGIAAVIMIIVAGFKYITSGGDAGKVGSAKSALVYALIGLAIVAIAQFLVHFVFTQATAAAPDSTSTTSTSQST